MADTPSIKITKQSAYKGGTKDWSNRYHFSGGTPADLSHWHTLATAIVADEKDCLQDTTTIVLATYYAAGSDLPLGSNAYSQAGALHIGSGVQKQPLFAAAFIRWSTDQRSIKNHPIYLMSYMHDVMTDLSGGPEALDGGQKAALEEYGQDWIDGFSDGTNTYHRAGPRGAVAQDKFVHTYITHRDFLN